MLTGLVFLSGLGMIVDDRLLLGETIWMKPMKFGFAFGIYALTLAWLLTKLVAIAAFGYFGLLVTTAWQARRGQSLIAPDALTLGVFAALTLTTTVATVFAIRAAKRCDRTPVIGPHDRTPCFGAGSRGPGQRGHVMLTRPPASRSRRRGEPRGAAGR